MVYGNHRHIPCAAKEQIVTISAHILPRKISRITGVSTRTIRRVLSLSQKTGAVERIPLQRGRPRELNALDLAVCLSFLISVQTLTG